MLFSYGSGQQWHDNNEKCMQIAGNFEYHGNAAVLRGVHRPMEHIQGFTWNWMPPLVKPWSTNSNETHKTMTKQQWYNLITT